MLQTQHNHATSKNFLPLVLQIRSIDNPTPQNEQPFVSNHHLQFAIHQYIFSDIQPGTSTPTTPTRHQMTPTTPKAQHTDMTDRHQHTQWANRHAQTTQSTVDILPWRCWRRSCFSARKASSLLASLCSLFS